MIPIHAIKILEVMLELLIHNFYTAQFNTQQVKLHTPLILYRNSLFHEKCTCLYTSTARLLCQFPKDALSRKR